MIGKKKKFKSIIKVQYKAISKNLFGSRFKDIYFRLLLILHFILYHSFSVMCIHTHTYMSNVNGHNTVFYTYLYILNPTARPRRDKSTIIKRNLIGFNSVFLFSKNGCLTKAT